MNAQLRVLLLLIVVVLLVYPARGQYRRRLVDVLNVQPDGLAGQDLVEREVHPAFIWMSLS